MIIDFHTHCFPEAIAARALETLSKKAGIPYLHSGTADALAQRQRKAGVSLSVVLPVVTKPSQTGSVNRWAAELNARNIGLYSFAGLHPENGDYAERLAEAASLGLRGVKLHPEYQSFLIDEKRYFPLYEAILSRGMTLSFHMGEDLGYEPPFHSSPARLARILRAFPGAPVVAAHFGGYNMWDEVEKHLIGKCVYLDLSYSAGILPAKELLRLGRAHGADKLLFGSDLPWYAPETVIKAVEEAGFTPDEKEMIYYKNAAGILGPEVIKAHL